MLRRAGAALLLALVLAAAPGAEPPAHALSCPVEPGKPPPDPYATHPVVVEGIPLSGPIVPRFGLGSPARMLVTRWIRGSGPLVVRVRTSVQLGVGPVYGHLPGYYAARPGSVARLFATRARDGTLHPNPCASGDRRRDPRSPLHTIRESAVRAAAGERAWRAVAQRGPFGLHCLVLHPIGRHTGGHDECEVDRPLLTVQHEHREDEDEIASTALAVAGRGIRGVELSTPDGPLALAPRGDGHPVLAVLAGRVDDAEIRARLTMVDGSVRLLRPVGFATELAVDPELRPPWRAALDPGRRTCVGVDQVPPRHGDAETDLEVDGNPLCRSLRRLPYFFAVRSARPQADTTELRPVPERTVLFGAAGPSVATITVRDASGERRLTPGRGGQFLTVYPASTGAADLVVEVAFRDGRTVVHRGRAAAP